MEATTAAVEEFQPEPAYIPYGIPYEYDPENAPIPDRSGFNFDYEKDFSYMLDNQSNETVYNGTNTTGSNILGGLPGQFSIKSKLCGFPGFCEDHAYDACLNTTLLSCGKCGITRSLVFICLVVIMGLAVVVGNGLIFCVGHHRHRKRQFHKMDACRCSLAAADILTGFQIFGITAYNFAWTINSTAQELDAKQLALRGSTWATVGGMFYLFGFTSSLYHLIYIGFQRLHAVKFPISHNMRGLKFTFTGLGIVWILSALSASVPAWYPNYFVFSYYVSTLLFYVTFKDISRDQTYVPAILYVCFAYVLPFLVMTIVTMNLGILLRRQLRKSHELVEARFAKESVRNRQKELGLFKTVTIMQCGFTITLIPVVVVVMLFYTNYLECSNISTPYLVCFYMSMSNSLVNIVVYTVRDKAFRSSFAEMFKTRKKFGDLKRSFPSSQKTLAESRRVLPQYTTSSVL